MREVQGEERQVPPVREAPPVPEALKLQEEQAEQTAAVAMDLQELGEQEETGKIAALAVRVPAAVAAVIMEGGEEEPTEAAVVAAAILREQQRLHREFKPEMEWLSFIGKHKGKDVTTQTLGEKFFFLS